MEFNDLLNWIATGAKDWKKGVQLYNHFGANNHLKNRFKRLGPIEYNRALLREELTSIAQMLEKSTRKLARGVIVTSLVLPASQPLSTNRQTFQVDQEESSTNLTVDLAILPEQLRKLHFKKGNLYNEASRLHKKLEETPQHVRASMVETIVENMRENQDIWAEIDYFKRNNKLKGSHPDLQQRAIAKDLKDVPREVLQRTLTNRRSNLSRYKKLIADFPDDDKKNKKRLQKVSEWTTEIKAIESILKPDAL